MAGAEGAAGLKSRNPASTCNSVTRIIQEARSWIPEALLWLPCSIVAVGRRLPGGGANWESRLGVVDESVDALRPLHVHLQAQGVVIQAHITSIYRRLAIVSIDTCTMYL